MKSRGGFSAAYLKRLVRCIEAPLRWKLFPGVEVCCVSGARKESG